MRKGLIIIIVLVAVLVFGFYFIEFDEGQEIVIGETSAEADYLHVLDSFSIEKVADSGVATGLAFAPDGRLFFTELPNKIKVVDNGDVRIFAEIPDAYIPAVDKGEAGPHSLALDLNYVYVYYLSNGAGKIGRYEDVEGVGRNFEIIFDGVPQWKVHNGGDLDFGLDGKLYLSTGDATDIKMKLGAENPAQDVNSLAGKVLRINKDGSVPEDNPFEGLYSYALGFRNIFGFAIDPVSGEIYAGDQGVDCCEEVNIVKEGKNYGWAVEMGIVRGGDYEDPIYAWDGKGRVSPTGMVVYNGDRYPEYKGDLFMTTWRTREIYRFVIEDDGVKRVEAFAVPGVYGSVALTGKHAGEVHEGQATESGSIVGAEGLLDIVQGADGYLYFSDVRGIYRLTKN